MVEPTLSTTSSRLQCYNGLKHKIAHNSYKPLATDSTALWNPWLNPYKGYASDPAIFFFSPRLFAWSDPKWCIYAYICLYICSYTGPIKDTAVKPETGHWSWNWLTKLHSIWSNWSKWNLWNCLTFEIFKIWKKLATVGRYCILHICKCCNNVLHRHTTFIIYVSPPQSERRWLKKHCCQLDILLNIPKNLLAQTSPRCFAQPREKKPAAL